MELGLLMAMMRMMLICLSHGAAFPPKSIHWPMSAAAGGAAASSDGYMDMRTPLRRKG
jgi:hypothetical protein